jgi:hypothetical protein
MHAPVMQLCYHQCVTQIQVARYRYCIPHAAHYQYTQQWPRPFYRTCERKQTNTRTKLEIRLYVCSQQQGSLGRNVGGKQSYTEQMKWQNCCTLG